MSIDNYFLGCISPQDDVNYLRDVYIVTELVDKGLTSVVKVNVDHRLMSCILYQICCGVSYPHFLGITYRVSFLNNSFFSEGSVPYFKRILFNLKKRACYRYNLSTTQKTFQ